MATTKKTIKKEVVPTVTLKSFTFRMLISTGLNSYSNVQPEITVETDSLEAGEIYAQKFAQRMHDQYFQCLDRKPAPKAVQPTPAPIPNSALNSEKKEENSIAKVPGKAQKPAFDTSIIKAVTKDSKYDNLIASSPWFAKAHSAVTSAGDERALDILKDGFAKSTKCSQFEKSEALQLVEETRKAKFAK